MKTSSKLKWFTVRLALHGVYDKDANEVVKDLQEELEMRPHLRNPNVSWEKEKHSAIIQVDNQERTSTFAADGMAEELLEVAAAVVAEFKRLKVDIIDVHPANK